MQRQTLIVSVSGTGNVVVGDAVAVDPSISGTVAELQVNVGSKVKAGDLLFRVVNSQLDAGVSQSLGSYQQAQSSAAQARISYEQAEETLEQMEATYAAAGRLARRSPDNRSAHDHTDLVGRRRLAFRRRLSGRNVCGRHGQQTTGAATATVTEDDIELQKEKVYQADLAVQAADTSVRTAKLNYDQSKVDAAKRTVSAPIDGVVTLLNVSNGQTLGSASVRSSSSSGGGGGTGGTSSSSSSSSSSQAPVVISNLSSAQALVQLNETDISSVKLGERSNLSFDAISGLTLTGKVTLIDIQGTVSSGVVTYNVTITPDIQDPRLKPGMTVTADIITAARPDVLTVPNAAVKTARDGSSYVEVLVQRPAGAEDGR